MDEIEDRARPTVGEVEERTSEALQLEGRRIRGLVPYGVQSRDMGGWREIIEPTAFHDTNFDELRAVIDHKGVPLATYPRTLQLEDRADGLRWSLDPPKSRADVVEAIERGDMRAGSWRMRVSKDRWEGDVRHVEAISDPYDVTLLGAELPAYPAAAIELRSHELEAPQPSPTAAEQQQEATMQEHDEERSSEERANQSNENSTSGRLNVESRSGAPRPTWPTDSPAAPHTSTRQASCYVVNRTSNFEVEINRARPLDSDRSEIRLRARLDYFYPYVGANCRGTGVP